MKLVTRKEWGARSAKPGRPKLGTPLGVAVHYSAANSDEQQGHEHCAARVRAIQAFHMDTRGWLDIAYSFLFCKHGFVFEGRGWNLRPASQGTNAGNDHYHSICFLGDDSTKRDDLTPDGRRALATFLLAAGERYPKARAVKPHSTFTDTACPGNELRQFIVRFQRLLSLP